VDQRSHEQQLPEFILSKGFSGVRPGYVFRSGDRGLGYYLDPKQQREGNPADASRGSSETEQSPKQPRSAVDVDAALARIAPALHSDKKFSKAADLLVQLMNAEIDYDNAHKFFDVMADLMLACDRDVHAPTFRDVYVRLVGAFYQKMLPLATEEQAFLIGTWRCRCCTANLVHTDDSFQFAKACKQLSEALEGVQNDRSLLQMDRRLAVLEAMHAAFPLHDRAWARPSIESSFKIATDKRLCFEDEPVDPKVVRQQLRLEFTRSGSMKERNDVDVKPEISEEAKGENITEARAGKTLRDEVDDFTSEIVARHRKRGIIGQQTVRTFNSTAHPLLTKRDGVLR
jgi:hypothetical protein